MFQINKVMMILDKLNQVNTTGSFKQNFDDNNFYMPCKEVVKGHTPEFWSNLGQTFNWAIPKL